MLPREVNKDIRWPREICRAKSERIGYIGIDIKRL
jgi:hypothetical protein